jgi:hypothetical protein
MLSYAESVFGDSRVDTSRSDNNSEGYEVAPQHDHDQEPHHLAAQLRVSEAMIMASTRCSDDMHALMADFCWRASVAHGSPYHFSMRLQEDDPFNPIYHLDEFGLIWMPPSSGMKL